MEFARHVIQSATTEIMPAFGYCCTTGGDAEDCDVLGRVEGAGRAGFLTGAGFAGVDGSGIVGSAWAFAAAGAGSSAGSTVSFWICFSIVRSLATFF